MMTSKEKRSEDAAKLRRQAETIARGKAANTPENLEALSPEETRQMLHELRVHQIELEMQNEELRRTQAELEASQARYFDLYDLAPTGYFTLSKQGLILEANLTAATLLGMTRGALVKQPITRFILKENQAIYYRQRKLLFETGTPHVFELRMVKNDGMQFWAHLSATAAQDPGGAPVCRVGLSDITERKQVEAELQQAYDELEHRVAERTEALRRANDELRTDIINRKQSEKVIIRTVQQLQETRDMLIQFEKEAAVGRLAAAVAHELLNPASIISSRLQFMEDETLTDKAGESVRICREQLQRIARIIQDLHQSSAIQPKPHVFGDLRDVIELSLKMSEGRIREDQVCVIYQPSPAIISVKMEREGISKMIVHLILNACDALSNTDQKRLIITVQYPIAADKPSSVLLIVADNGCGVSEGDMKRIFDPFFTTKDPGKGTGLGLSVCKGIIADHRGTIHVEKNDMGGASFIVELPLSDS
jgi:PAS domain S-box-containing protein